MNIRKFIGASSFILLAWLGATYLHQVPLERYPKQEKAGPTASVKTLKMNEKMIAIAESDQSDKY